MNNICRTSLRTIAPRGLLWVKIILLLSAFLQNHFWDRSTTGPLSGAPANGVNLVLAEDSSVLAGHTWIVDGSNWGTCAEPTPTTDQLCTKMKKSHKQASANLCFQTFTCGGIPNTISRDNNGTNVGQVSIRCLHSFPWSWTMELANFCQTQILSQWLLHNYKECSASTEFQHTFCQVWWELTSANAIGLLFRRITPQHDVFWKRSWVDLWRRFGWRRYSWTKLQIEVNASMLSPL